AEGRRIDAVRGPSDHSGVAAALGWPGRAFRQGMRGRTKGRKMRMHSRRHAESSASRLMNSHPLLALRDRLRWCGHRFTASSFATEFLPAAAAKARNYVALTRLDRPIGVWLLLWPVLWALWLSSAGKPDPHVFVVFVLGVVLTRSAGCAINDFADRNFDGHVRRTRE